MYVSFCFLASGSAAFTHIASPLVNSKAAAFIESSKLHEAESDTEEASKTEFRCAEAISAQTKDVKTIFTLEDIAKVFHTDIHSFLSTRLSNMKWGSAPSESSP